MSNSIDERIVQMQFDNKQFENGVKTSMKSIDSLKKGLNFDESVKSLSTLEKVGRAFSLAGIADGVDRIASRFSALGIIGMTALQNITNSIINTGSQMLKSLTIDPIKAGLGEYETKMGAIQTILTNTASKGTTLADVTKTLDELNAYSDKTIYNFAEMARNIGTFTAAGVGLKESAVAIQGIANLAAGSGSSAIQASTAMYQLSQALASGSVKLQDWNSVVNAGMGGELFQNALKTTAKSMGIVVNESIPFRESLEKGWITTEVLTKTLAKFAEDKSLLKAATQVKTFTQLFDTMKESVQSGWAKSWELIIGDIAEAASILTSINDAFSKVAGSSADARNEMLAFWKANGGRTALLEGISNVLIGLASVMEPIEKAFREIFPAMTGKRLVELTKSFRDLTENFKIGEETAAHLKSTFKGLFAVLDIGFRAFSFIIDVIGVLVQTLFPVTGGILATTAGIGDFLVAIDEWVKGSNIFAVALTKIKSIIEFLKDTIASVTVDTKIFKDAVVKVQEAVTYLYTAIKNIVSGFSGINIHLNAASKASDGVSSAFDGVSAASTSLKGALSWIGGTFKTIVSGFEKAGAAIKSVFGPAIEGLIKNLSNLSLSDIGAFLGGGGIFMIAKTLKSSVGSIKDVTDGFNSVINGISGTLEAFQTKLKAEALLKIAFAIGILAAAIVALSLIKSEELTKALMVLTVLFTELSAALLILQKSSFTLSGVTGTLIALGISILLLVTALKKLTDIDHDQLVQGIEGLSAIMMLLGVFIRYTANVSAIQTSVASVIAISVAVLILASAVKKFSSIDPAKMQQGITGIAASLMSLAVFIKLVGSPENMISLGIGVAAIGAAMYLFAGAVALFGLIPLSNMVKGLSGMAAALMAITLAANLMPKDASIIAMGIGLNLMGVALYAIAGAVAIFGNMSLQTLAIGISALAAALLVMTVAARGMTGTLSGAAALLVMALAINTLVPAIAILGNLSLATIGVALLALAGVFVVLGLSGLILTPLAPIILTLAASVGVLGVGIYLLGGGLVLFAAGVAAFAAGGTVLIAALTGIIMAIVNLIPVAAKKLGEGVVALLKAIADSMPAIITALKAIFTALIKLFDEMVPPLVDSALRFIKMLYKKINDSLPELLQLGLNILKTLLKGIAANIKDITKSALDIVIAFLKGVADKLPSIIKVGADIIIALLEGIGKEVPRIIKAGFKLVIDFINGLADALRENIPILLKAVNNVVWAILDGLTSGLRGGISSVVDIGKNIVTGLIDGIKGMLKKVGDIGANLGKSVLDAAKGALGIHSPSQMFKEIGLNITKGLTNGITDNADKAVTASKDMSDKTVKASSEVVKKSNESAKKAFDAAVDWIDERKYYNTLSLAQELAEWEKIQKQYAKGSDERKKADREVYRVKQELIKKQAEDEKAVFDKSIELIDDKKYYNQLSLKDELVRWQQMQAKYAEGSEERKKIDREVYRVQKELRDKNKEEQEKALETEYNNSVKWIDNKKYYNQLSLSEELAAWERVQARYDLGTANRIQADKEVYRVKNEMIAAQKVLDDDYYAKSKEITDKMTLDVNTLNDAYNTAVDSRTKSLYDAYGLFDELAKKETVSGATLIKNLKDQVNEFEIWSKNIKDLAAKGVDEGLIKELTDMGPKAVTQIQALNTLSGPQLEQYVTLWRTKHGEARNQAMTELEGLRTDTGVKMQAITTQAKTDLDALKLTWSTAMKKLTGDAKIDIASVATASNTSLTTLNTQTTDQLNTLKTTWDTQVCQLVQKTVSQFNGLASTITSIGWYGVGVNIVQGMMSGIMSQASALAATAAAVARQALSATESALDINSPSKEFAKVGKFAILGMVEGMNNFSGKVVTSATNVGNVAISALQGAISDISNVLDSSIDMNPVIRPVLDLSDVVAGGQYVNGLFSKKQGISVSAISSKLPSIGQTSQNGSVNTETSSKPVQGNVSFVQNNYSPKALSRIEIYRQTKNLVKGVMPV